MVAVVALATGVVVIVKVAVVAPLATVTLAGTVAEALSLLSCTTAPPLGAGALSVTVPWDIAPPVTLVGLTASVFSAGGFTVRVAVLVTPL